MTSRIHRRDEDDGIAMPSQDDEFSSSRLIAGKYRLGSLIGEGGMGSVYEAEHVGLGTQFAVKILAEHSLSDSVSQARFKREARAAAAVRHPNVVGVTDAGTDDEGTPFIVMELLQGETLSAVLKRRRAIRPETAIAVTSQILAGLAAAHERGVIHRDLKPANIFLVRRADGTRRVKILDFGISKFGDARTTQDVTRDGALVGTPHFMAPEQLACTGSLDARVDIYAVGVLLYRMVTGRMPYSVFGAESLENQLRNAEVLSPEEIQPSVGKTLGAVILKAMAFSPGERFESSSAFREALLASVPEDCNADALLAGERDSDSPPLGGLVPRLDSSASSSASLGDPSGAFVDTPTDGLNRDQDISDVPVGFADGRDPGSRTRRMIQMFAIVALVCGLTASWFWQRAGSKWGASSDSKAVASSSEDIRIGVTRYLPQHLIEKRFKGIVGHLKGRLERGVDLVVAEDYFDIADKLLAREITLGVLTPYAYVRAKRAEADIEVLATSVTRRGGSKYQGYILSRADSGIQSLADLRGRTFCYVHPTSTSGYLYPRAMLLKAGVDPDSAFRSTVFAGEHLASLRALHSGACAGAAAYSHILFEGNKHGMAPSDFRILATTDPIPHDAYCVRSDMAEEDKAALRQELLSLRPGSDTANGVFRDSSYLVGFTSATDKDYDSVRKVERYLNALRDRDTRFADGASPPTVAGVRGQNKATSKSDSKRGDILGRDEFGQKPSSPPLLVRRSVPTKSRKTSLKN